ncbi:hypothetical protein KA183_01075 [bacterium]|nr:hypothetical protein [bacterium]QQR59118.1 MAG: hypothetical protein IPG59_06405 [Candidatus Melainabacteria bacterium]
MEYIQGAAAHNFAPVPAEQEEARMEVDNLLNSLLDSVFDPAETEIKEAVQQEMRPRVFKRHSQVSISNPNRMKESAGGGKLVPLFEKGNSASLQKPSIFGPDDDEEMLLKFEMRTKLLEAQLDSRNRELRLTVERMRILELALVEKDEQMEIIPELMARCIQATQYEEELVQLKDSLECLSEELTMTTARMDDLKSHWLGRFSLWICEQK